MPVSKTNLLKPSPSGSFTPGCQRDQSTEHWRSEQQEVLPSRLPRELSLLEICSDLTCSPRFLLLSLQLRSTTMPQAEKALRWALCPAARETGFFPLQRKSYFLDFKASISTIICVPVWADLLAAEGPDSPCGRCPGTISTICGHTPGGGTEHRWDLCTWEQHTMLPLHHAALGLHPAKRLCQHRDLMHQNAQKWVICQAHATNALMARLLQGLTTCSCLRGPIHPSSSPPPAPRPARPHSTSTKPTLPLPSPKTDPP